METGRRDAERAEDQCRIQALRFHTLIGIFILLMVALNFADDVNHIGSER